MKTSLVILLFVLFGLGTVMTKTVVPDINKDKLELIFKIKQDIIKKSDIFFDATLTLKNISNDTIIIPSWHMLDFSCGNYPADITLEFYHINGEKSSIPTPAREFQKVPSDYDDSIVLKPGAYYQTKVSKYDWEIKYGCPLEEKGTFKVRAVLNEMREIGLNEKYYSNFDTIIVK